jgi:hypothetical protein
MADEFKPNIYPIIYWALAYGVVAGFVLFLMFLLARYITIVWFPVFLVGLAWGGFRNYRKQKRMWSTQSGVPLTPKSPIQEFREAVSDVTDAAREMVAQQRAEDAAIAEQEAQEQAALEDEIAAQEAQNSLQPPATPTQPGTPA